MPLAIWLQLIAFALVSPTPNDDCAYTLVCCCKPWRLYFMRRRVTYAIGASFIEHYVFMLFWSYLACLGALSGALGAVLGWSLATRGSRLAAQAA